MIPFLSQSGRAAIAVWLTIFVIYAGVVLLKHDPSFSVDGKVYYVGAATLVSGGDPYITGDMVRMSAIKDPGGFAVGEGGESVSNLPAALIPAIPFLVISWHGFTWLLLAGNTLCIPLTFLLAARLFGKTMTPKDVWLYSLIAAAFPPVWRTAFVGQNTLLVLVCQLTAVLAVEADYSLPTAFLTFASFTKITCSTPSLFLLFVNGSRRIKSVMVLCAAVFMIANCAIIAHLGVKTFVKAYKIDNFALFGPHGSNDSYFAARDTRIDLEPLIAEGMSRSKLPFGNLVAAVVMLVPLLLLVKRRPDAVALHFTGILIYALLVTYHRPYDVVQALPALYLCLEGLRGSDKRIAVIRLIPFLVAAAVLGDHNVLDILARRIGPIDWPWFRPLLTLSMYLTLLAPELYGTALDRPEPGSDDVGIGTSALRSTIQA